MKYIKTYENFGEYRGVKVPLYGYTPNWEDIKDILKGLSRREVLKWIPPNNRIALSKTENDLFNKKRDILQHFGCPREWVKKPLTSEDITKWCLNDPKRGEITRGKLGIK